MKGVEIRGYPLLLLLAISQFAAPERPAVHAAPRVAPAPHTAPPPMAKRADEVVTETPPDLDERSLGLLLLLGDGAAHWRAR